MLESIFSCRLSKSQWLIKLARHVVGILGENDVLVQ